MSSNEDSQAGRSISARELRETLGRFATGVTVMTARDSGGQMVAVTVNSFTSVSLDPPLILWCLALTSNSEAVFQVGTPFVVNVLADDQLSQAKQFARTGRSEFGGAHFNMTGAGVPRLEGCVAALECQITARYPGGDHAILLARVSAVHQGSDHPLVFFGGRFRRLAGSHLGEEGRPSWFPWQDD